MEILNTCSVYNEYIGIIPTFTIITFLLLTIIFIIKLYYKEWKDSIICFIFAICCLILSHGLIQWWESSEVKHYEVLISDYNKLDFNKYEIIDKKGKITVIKEIK